MIVTISKAYYYLPHDLIVVKFKAYSLNSTGLNFFCHYLTSRRQRIKVNSSYSSCSSIIRTVPQGS